MRPLSSTFAFLLLSACSGTWAPADIDGDGYTVATGDCWDHEVGPEGLNSADIHPGAQEVWYDGFDQDCAGDNDFDKDGDGHASVAHPDPTGRIASDDCWDDTDELPSAFEADDPANQLGAADVFPSATEIWYDGIDQDCAGDNDYDQDGDGFTSAANPGPSGPGDDCFDGPEDDFTNDGGLEPEAVNPEAEDSWYDGTDADCAGDNDFDQDRDGFPRDLECDDLDATRYPDPSLPETWYDGVDDNCDGNDGDQDGDGYYIAGYAFEIPAEYLPGDCYDNPADLALWAPVNDFPVFGPEAANPGAVETWYDGLDQNCAGDDDFDQDVDGFGTDVYPTAGGIFGDDCDDLLASTNPSATELWYDGVDADCAGDDDFDQDHDGYTNDTDCDDTASSVSPGELEACGNDVDEDCSGSDNDDGAIGCSVFYADADSDGFGADPSACLCEVEAPYIAATSTDCDDGDATVNPGGTESCSTAADDDCDGSTNDVGAVGCTAWYLDADRDTYGTTASQCACEADGDYSSTNDDDCNDSSATIYPGRAETCNDIDDDCDSSIDEGLPVYYADSDGDTYGDSAVSSCSSSGGAVANDDDCDDTNDRIYLGATEFCDGGPNDCATADTWVEADEDQLVTFVDTAGDWSDVSSIFATAPASSTLAYIDSGTYHFCAGTYYTRIVANLGTTDLIGIYGADRTTLENGAATGSVVSVTNSQVLLSGFTITGGKGNAGFGGGILASVTGTTPPASPHLEVEDCIVTGNTAPRGGGVSVLVNGWVKLVRTTVEDNTATATDGSGDGGGGLHAKAGADLTLEDSYVQNNSATTNAGGIHVDSGTLVLTRSFVTGNTAGDNGGGIVINTGTATCTSGGITDNVAGDHGGGVYLSNHSSSTALLTVVSCEFGTDAAGNNNAPTDVSIKTGGGPGDLAHYSSYGATASFLCSNVTDLCTSL